MENQTGWPDQLFDVLKGAEIRQVGYVPDAGHARLIARCKADNDIRDVVLSTEEEGVALAAGASVLRWPVYFLWRWARARVRTGAEPAE